MGHYGQRETPNCSPKGGATVNPQSAPQRFMFRRWAGIRTVALLAVSMVVALAGSARATSATPSFTAVDLGTLGGATSFARDVNDAGEIVGSSPTAAGDDHAFVWTQVGGLIDLGTLGGARSFANFVTNSGQVVGTAYLASGYWHPFSWTQSGGMVDVGSLGGANSSSSPEAVNRSGEIAGLSNWSSFPPPLHAFSWTRADGMVDLGTLGGTGNTTAWGVNDAGWVVGQSSTPSGEWHAFLWKPSAGMTDLGTLGGSTSQALDVNDTGRVVGYSNTASGEQHAFSWTQTTGMVDLGTLGGSTSHASAVNYSGQIVGTSTIASGEQHAFSWTPAGGMVDIGTLGGSTSSLQAYDMVLNDAGQVVGYSTTSSGRQHAFMWTQAGGIVDLGTLGGLVSSAAAISDGGLIVGYSSTASNQLHATLWRPMLGDTTPPTLTVPTGLTVEATSAAGAEVVFSASATDDVDPAPTVTCLPASGSTFPFGDTTVACTATDSSDNTATASFVVHVRDLTAPTLTVPAGFTLDATAEAGAIATYTVSAADAVDPAPIVTCTPSSGTTFRPGDTIVGCTATDASGNTASASFTVHVRGAGEQLAGLALAVRGVGPGKSLSAMVAVTQWLVGYGQTNAACLTLTAFNLEVRAQAGKEIPTAQATALIADANRIKTVLGCTK
jgi:probable HAF family extracellular repeat protein